MPLNIARIREDFPNLKVVGRDGQPIVYFDNAATTFKPCQVISQTQAHYCSRTANIHRGVHYLSEQATADYEAVREKVRRFLNARTIDEIVFTKGATESINLVAASWGRTFLKEGDEILISAMEHHANIVPWQLLREATGCVIKVIPIDDDGQIIFEEYRRLLKGRVKLVSVVHVSNSLGTVNPIMQMSSLAHQIGALFLLDAAQGVTHEPIDVAAWDVDFLVFSGHKLFGPTGVGVLYGKQAILESMPPYQGGGDMILSVTFEKTIFNRSPLRFEAGTPNVAGVIGMGGAIDYLRQFDWNEVMDYKKELLDYGTAALTSIEGLRMIGTAKHKAPIFSFVLDGVHAHDIGTLIDREGIAIRTGHHCTQPVMKRFGVPATARASLAIYNTKEEIDLLAAALRKICKFFK